MSDPAIILALAEALRNAKADFDAAIQAHEQAHADYDVATANWSDALQRLNVAKEALLAAAVETGRLTVTEGKA